MRAMRNHSKLRYLPGSGFGVNVVDIVKRELRLGPADKRSLDGPGLLEHLQRVTRDKLAVDRPNYSTYKRLINEKKEKN